MRKLRVIVCLAFVASCAVFAGNNIKARMFEDHEAPVITCEDDTVMLSVAGEQDEELMKGIKAEDNRDGDLTDAVRVASMSHFISPGKRTVTYVVFDSSNQVGMLERTVQYTDYTSPKIRMTEPLRMSLTDLGKASLSEHMTASDCLDGDLTNQIRITLNDGIYSGAAGTYSVTVQVSNSAGDVCALPLDLVVTDSADAQESLKQYPVLSEYIVYTKVGQAIDPMAYIKGIEQNGAVYTYAENGDVLAGTLEAIAVTANVDYSKAGVYTVDYAFTAVGAPTAVTRMYVVVEEDIASAQADGGQ